MTGKPRKIYVTVEHVDGRLVLSHPSTTIMGGPGKRVRYFVDEKQMLFVEEKGRGLMNSWNWVDESLPEINKMVILLFHKAYVYYTMNRRRVKGNDIHVRIGMLTENGGWDIDGDDTGATLVGWAEIPEIDVEEVKRRAKKINDKREEKL